MKNDVKRTEGRNKSKELIKVAAVSALSIGIFSAAFVGLNQIAFASATSRTATLPPIETTASPILSLPSQLNTMAAFNLTVVELPMMQSTRVIITETEAGSHYRSYRSFSQPSEQSDELGEVPANALSAEEAAQIGAQYIYDVFGESINNKYVAMRFSVWPSNSRVYWHGSVMSRLPEDLHNHGRADAQHMMYTFMVDAVTGMRVDISTGFRFQTIEMSQEEMDRELDMFLEWRQSGLVRAWYTSDDETSISLEERMEYLGLTAEQLELYTTRAKELAQRHFNNSEVVDVQLGGDLGRVWNTGLIAGPRRDANGNVYTVLESLYFSVTDDTGRIASVTIPSSSSDSNGITISTQHNDIIPGFFHEYPGIG